MTSRQFEMSDFPIGTRVEVPLRGVVGVVIGYGTTSPGYVRVGYDYLPDEDRYASSTVIHAYYVQVAA